jgi:hypothetical protein
MIYVGLKTGNIYDIYLLETFCNIDKCNNDITLG